MRAIHKQILTVTDEQIILLPKHAVPLSVAEQRDALCIWYGCDLNEPDREEHTVRIIGTGNPVPDVDLGAFLGTVITMGGALVWHVFVASTAAEV